MTVTVVRFTPTCVGTSEGDYFGRADEEVHPHVRGDIIYGGMMDPSESGSPPRAWGHRNVSANDLSVFGSPPRAWGHLW